MAMGFPEKNCKKALKSCDMNDERETDRLFSHMEDPDEDQEMPADGGAGAANLNDKHKCDKPGIYQL